MKPQRMRMAHNLLLNYGLYRKMEIYVSFGFLSCGRLKVHYDKWKVQVGPNYLSVDIKTSTVTRKNTFVTEYVRFK